MLPRRARGSRLRWELVSYEPGFDDWQVRSAAACGMDPDGVAVAIAHHHAHETRWRPDFLTDSGRYVGVADEPTAAGDVLGPVRPRGGPNGVILRDGHIVAEWGDTRRADMSFSIAKSYLTVAGAGTSVRSCRRPGSPRCAG